MCPCVCVSVSVYLYLQQLGIGTSGDGNTNHRLNLSLPSSPLHEAGTLGFCWLHHRTFELPKDPVNTLVCQLDPVATWPRGGSGEKSVTSSPQCLGWARPPRIYTSY